MLRYFVRIGENIVWADRPEDLMEDLLQRQELPPGIDPPLPMSVTFIPGSTPAPSTAKSVIEQQASS